jgi:hypothetical protein
MVILIYLNSNVNLNQPFIRSIMKHLILIVLYLCMSSALSAQTLDQLDQKAGFKNLKLNDDFSKYKDSVVFMKKSSDSSSVYRYTGSCCNSVFQFPVDNILLVFKSNKLVGIVITLQKFQKEYSTSQRYTKFDPINHESIKNSFQILYGPPTGNQVNNENPTYSWQGKNVLLTSTYEYLGVQNGDQETITIMLNSYIINSVKSGF